MTKDTPEVIAMKAALADITKTSEKAAAVIATLKAMVTPFELTIHIGKMSGNNPPQERKS